MDVDGLKSAWQAQVPDGGGAVGRSEMGTLLNRLATLERDVRRRDVREYIAACVVMAFFTWRGIVEAEPLARIGYAIVVLGAMFIIVWSRRAAAPPSARAFAGDLPVAHFLERELARVDAQIRLLRSVWWWYVSPTIVGLLLTLVPGERAPLLRAALAAFFIAVGVAIHWLNVTAARTQLEPLRDELAATLSALR